MIRFEIDTSSGFVSHPKSKMNAKYQEKIKRISKFVLCLVLVFVCVLNHRPISMAENHKWVQSRLSKVKNNKIQTCMFFVVNSNVEDTTAFELKPKNHVRLIVIINRPVWYSNSFSQCVHNVCMFEWAINIQLNQCKCCSRNGSSKCNSSCSEDTLWKPN